MHLRWAVVAVKQKTTFDSGPGFTMWVKQLQQAWENDNGEVDWRPVPETE